MKSPWTVKYFMVATFVVDYENQRTEGIVERLNLKFSAGFDDSSCTPVQNKSVPRLFSERLFSAFAGRERYILLARRQTER